jgi:hypothetical protein
MGRLVTNNAMSINGAFEAPSPDEWLVLDPDSNNVSLEQFLVADAMLLGRKTYKDSLQSGRSWWTTRLWGCSRIGSTACPSTWRPERYASRCSGTPLCSKATSPKA